MKRFMIPFLALPLLAVCCAWIGNAAASKQRRLGWSPFTVAPIAVPAPLMQAPTPSTLPAPTPTRQPLLKALVKPSAKTAIEGPSRSPERARIRFHWDPTHLERDISSAEAFEAFELGVPFFDARRSTEFEAGHIPGAHSAPVWEDGLQERVAALTSLPVFQPRQVRLASPVVLYCSGGSCEDSHLLAQQMIPLGFGNLLIYQDGFPDWQGKGRAVATGPEKP